MPSNFQLNSIDYCVFSNQHAFALLSNPVGVVRFSPTTGNYDALFEAANSSINLTIPFVGLACGLRNDGDEKNNEFVFAMQNNGLLLQLTASDLSLKRKVQLPFSSVYSNGFVFRNELFVANSDGLLVVDVQSLHIKQTIAYVDNKHARYNQYKALRLHVSQDQNNTLFINVFGPFTYESGVQIYSRSLNGEHSSVVAQRWFSTNVVQSGLVQPSPYRLTQGTRFQAYTGNACGFQSCPAGSYTAPWLYYALPQSTRWTYVLAKTRVDFVVDVQFVQHSSGSDLSPTSTQRPAAIVVRAAQFPSGGGTAVAVFSDTTLHSFDNVGNQNPCPQLSLHQAVYFNLTGDNYDILVFCGKTFALLSAR